MDSNGGNNDANHNLERSMAFLDIFTCGPYPVTIFHHSLVSDYRLRVFTCTPSKLFSCRLVLANGRTSHILRVLSMAFERRWLPSGLRHRPGRSSHGIQNHAIVRCDGHPLPLSTATSTTTQLLEPIDPASENARTQVPVTLATVGR